MKAKVGLSDEELVCPLAQQETTDLEQRLCCCSSVLPNMTTGATRKRQVAAGPFPVGPFPVGPLDH